MSKQEERKFEDEMWCELMAALEEDAVKLAVLQGIDDPYELEDDE